MHAWLTNIFFVVQSTVIFCLLLFLNVKSEIRIIVPNSSIRLIWLTICLLVSINPSIVFFQFFCQGTRLREFFSCNYTKAIFSRNFLVNTAIHMASSVHVAAAAMCLPIWNRNKFEDFNLIFSFRPRVNFMSYFLE